MPFTIRLPKTRLLAASLLLFSLFFIHQSCTKLDTGGWELSQDPTEKFFNVPAGTEPQVLRIIDNLKQQNRLTGFIKKLATKEGYAVWNKAMAATVAKPVVTNLTGSVVSAPDTIIYIPLVLENTNYVNSFIYARLNGTVHLRLYRSREYNLQGYDTSRTDNAERLALQFMMLDKQLFGADKFTVHDCRLFKGTATDTTLTQNKHRNLTLSVENSTTGNNWRWEEIVVTTCTTEWGYIADPIHSGIFIHQGYITTCHTSTLSFIVEDDLDDEIDLPPTGGGGGGSTGGTGVTPPYPGAVPCNPNPLIENGLIPCERGNTTGWTLGAIPEGCDPFITTLQNDADFNDKLNLLRNGDYSAQYERGYKAVGIGGSLYIPMDGELNAAEIKINYFPGQPFQGVMHHHYAGLAPMFSPGDVVSMAETFLTGYAMIPKDLFYTVSGIDNAGNKMNYMMKIKDTAKFRIFANKIASTKIMSANFKDKYDSKFAFGNNNDFNEKGFLSMMADFGINSGFDLYRGDGSGINVTWQRLYLSGDINHPAGTPFALEVKFQNCN